MTDITEFKGDYRFLSNFWPCQPPGVQVHYGLCGEDNNRYPTVEHAYQASKTMELPWRKLIRDSPTAGKAKRLGKIVPIRHDWDNTVKIDCMLWLLRQKFQHNPLRQMLINTNDCMIIEGNHWGDTFWGICRGAGRNELGHLLMLVRWELKHNKLQTSYFGRSIKGGLNEQS